MTKLDKSVLKHLAIFLWHPRIFLRFWSSLEGVTVVLCMETFTKHSACRHFSVLALFWPSTTMDLYIYMWPDSVYVWLLTGWEKRFKAFIKSLDYARKILCDFPNAWQIIEGALKLDNLVLSKKIGKVAFWIISYRFLYKGPDDSE